MALPARNRPGGPGGSFAEEEGICGETAILKKAIILVGHPHRYFGGPATHCVFVCGQQRWGLKANNPSGLQT
jgi:hypothetical protein